MRGLNCKSVAGLELVLPILAHFLDDSAEFVTYNGGVFLNIVGNPLVFASFNGSLVCAHTDRVGYDFYAHPVRSYVGKLYFVKAEIHFPVYSYSFSFHFTTFLFDSVYFPFNYTLL